MKHVQRIAIAIVCALALGACTSSDDTARETPTTAQPRPSATTRRATNSIPCSTTAAAARAAAAIHYANTGSFPRTFADMTAPTPPELELPKGVAQSGTTVRQDPDWELTIAGGGTTEPMFTCTALRPLPSIP